MSKINQMDRARLAWPVLATVAEKRQTITYKELGAHLGVHHRAIRYVLGPIQEYCMESALPPMTILVVNGSGLPGTGFIAHNRKDLDSGIERVWSYPWRQERNPFDFAAEGLSYDSLLTGLTENPDEAEQVYTKVKSRGIQQILFRDAVRKAYSWQCAFTGMEFPDALEACHIVPWPDATPQQRLDVRNGVLLNPLHHKLFDTAYITVRSDYTIAYWDPSASSRQHSKLEASLTTQLHGQQMRLPRFAKHRPLADYIEQHNDTLRSKFDEWKDFDLW
ncbi:HNH endonuclease [Cupriavidus numazuensis]|uniref:HNH nuclease domain-containing protein n=1 Tax=Cupriavidus numazuensis TaxID=221992 RepID=A0ABM8TBH0_9BURK|nr:HNH endonuclease [Cupriavidus numazuensis]CAG2132276.1 hypothetical protein LMG26411_00587 [Cupriavidus numazuensis]